MVSKKDNDNFAIRQAAFHAMWNEEGESALDQITEVNIKECSVSLKRQGDFGIKDSDHLNPKSWYTVVGYFNKRSDNQGYEMVNSMIIEGTNQADWEDDRYDKVRPFYMFKTDNNGQPITADYQTFK